MFELSDKVQIDNSIGTIEDMLHTSHLASYDALYKFTVNNDGKIIRIEKPMSFLNYKNGINYTGLVPYESDDYVTLGNKRVYPYNAPVYLVGMDDGEYIMMYYSSFSALRNRRMDKGSFHMRFISYETPNKLDCVVVFGDIEKLYLEYSTARALVTEKTEVYENGEMYYFEFEKDKKTWNFGAEPLPFISFQFGNLVITDEELLEDLEKVPKCNVVLEADIAILGVSVNDKKYKRPANPATCMIADAASGMMLKCELQEPDDDVIVSLAEELIGFIFQYGAPKEVRVSNILVEAGLEQICETCGIKLRRVRKLQAIEEFRDGMKHFM